MDNKNLQQSIDDCWVAAGPAEMVHQTMQTFAGGCGPQLFKGDWQIDGLIEVTTVDHCMSTVCVQRPTRGIRLLTWIVS